MAGPKTNQKLSSLGKEHTKNHLKRFYPFLSKQFRALSEKELKDEKVFKELFGDEAEVNLEFLNAIYKFQQCDTKTRETSASSNSADIVKA